MHFSSCTAVSAPPKTCDDAISEGLVTIGHMMWGYATCRGDINDELEFLWWRNHDYLPGAIDDLGTRQRIPQNAYDLRVDLYPIVHRYAWRPLGL
jgi:hypothetical protein